MPTAVNLWPNGIAQVTMRTPTHILKEQAQFLNEATDFAVQGRVTTMGLEDNKISITLDLMVPQIRNYSYQLVRVDHSIAPLYPLIVWAKFPRTFDPLQYQTDRKIINSEAEFISTLKQIFESEDTKAVLSNLIAIAKQ